MGEHYLSLIFIFERTDFYINYYIIVENNEENKKFFGINASSNEKYMLVLIDGFYVGRDIYSLEGCVGGISKLVIGERINLKNSIQGFILEQNSNNGFDGHSVSRDLYCNDITHSDFYGN